MIVFAYSMSEMKIAYALLQPFYGGTISTFNLHKFGTENWQLSPTSDMKLYMVKDEEELDHVVQMTKAARKSA